MNEISERKKETEILNYTTFTKKEKVTFPKSTFGKNKRIKFSYFNKTKF